MKSPKMPGPSAEELTLQRQQIAEMEKRDQQLRQEEATRAIRLRQEEETRVAGRSGLRSLLSGDWVGFRRGGDLGVR